MPYLMKCGHVSNVRTREGKPCCVMCVSEEAFEVEREVSGSDGLEGRQARCNQHEGREERLVVSRWDLPFFRHTPNFSFDQYYCGCRGWE